MRRAFPAGLAPRNWVIQQGQIRRAHLLVIETRSGAAALRGTIVKFEAPAVLWLPGDVEGDLQVEAGAQGYFIAVSEDLLTRTVAGSAEALHLRRTTDRLVHVERRADRWRASTPSPTPAPCWCASCVCRNAAA